ncbi:MAG: PAS domain-containing protein [Cycloclasticus sp.]
MSINNTKEPRSQLDKLSTQCFDNASTPMFAIDENHIITHWNKALVDVSGFTSKAMIGTRDQWKPFYTTSRPCLADLVVDGANMEEIEKLYPSNKKLSLANGLSIQAEDFFPSMKNG